ncbi:MAG: aspartate aminotransferase family protein [Flavobacteriaceae bacterium]|nr:aspartate aminotransferase family protein [Flavobacteriaceae bacterium]
MNKRFKKYQAQTTSNPLGLEIKKAKGSFIYSQNKKYLDFVAGVSVNNLGHSNSEINKAINEQLDKYSHVMVYGEFVQEKSIVLCELLSELLPKKLNCTYLTNSGTEAIEASLKLAKRITGRQKIVSMKNAYHGSTHGSLSVSGYEKRKRRYRPLLPNIFQINFNSKNDLSIIDNDTACVIIEPIQGGAGFISAKNEYLKEIRKLCDKHNVILIFDELQTGIGRTGKMFAFENYKIVPDVLVIGKALGGGFPIGALISNRKLLSKFISNPELGHITTFGGHPVIASAGLKTLQIILREKLHLKTIEKEKIFRDRLKHNLIYEIRGSGLMLCLIMKNSSVASQLVSESLNNGLILFFLLYEKRAVRITPPLTISENEINKGCDIIIQCLNKIN